MSHSVKKRSDEVATPPRTVRWWHCFFGHHWGQWEATVVDVLSVDDQGGPDQHRPGMAYQQRRCLRCGVIKQKPR